ncbi:MAG: hypothetical protein MJ175_06295, partial [Clostridia bacterium]|nr:hypothetical protein [Clostridia bacterium]
LLLLLPASALTLSNGVGSSVFDELPAEYKNAEFVHFSDFFEEGKTNARMGTNDDFGGYVYLKQDGLGDYTIPFEVKEDGEYLFGVEMMGWQASVPRTTNFRVDDSPWLYIYRDYEDDDQFLPDFFYGFSGYLTKGQHTVTLSLAIDFDDSTTKSLYMTDFYYVLNPVQPTEEAPAEALPEDVTADTPADAPAAEPDAAPATNAPTTADVGVVVAAGCMALCAAVILVKKNK